MSLTLRSNQSLVKAQKAVSVFCEFLSAIDTPVSLSVYLLLKAGEFEQVARKRINPRDYLTASRFRNDYQAVSGLRKSGFLKTNINKRQAALIKFLEAEEACRKTNLKFNNLMYGGGIAALNAEDPEMLRTLERAASLIKRILGPVPKKLDFRFGPGVTSSVKKHVTLPKKYASKLDVTPSLFGFLPDILGPLWVKELKEVGIITHSQIAFVPKDALTDRTICIEPHVNGYVQLGIGKHLRERFAPWVNLRVGQEINRFLVSMAHEWRLATVDLSSASDTIARALLWYLLPEDWVTLLDQCRSASYMLDGEVHEFEKFSSMGNGFTFELESIIFYALTRASGSSRVMTSTYGDDIVCEDHVYDKVVKTLEFCGFSVNTDKSFCNSPFYESCGSDFFHGEQVRPFFWKELNPSSIFRMANDISRFAALRSYGRDTAFKKSYDSLRYHDQRVSNVLCPQGVGDVGFVADFDEAVPHVRRLPDGWCGFSYKALKHRPLTYDHSYERCGLLSKLDSPSDSWDGYREITEPRDHSNVPIRGSGAYQIGRSTHFGEWSGYGPWL